MNTKPIWTDEDDRQVRVAVLTDRLARARRNLQSDWLGRLVYRIFRRHL